MKVRKMLALLMTVVLAAGLIGCSSKGTGETTAAGQTQAVTEGAAQSQAPSEKETAASGLDETTPVTLKLFGPGLLAAVGESGALDLVSGIEMPGYEKLVKRWNELHPNVTLVIEAQPWDNWQAAIQTAVLSGDVDIIMHGASLADLVEPLEPYLEKDAGLMDEIFSVAQRRTDVNGDLSVMTTTGVSYAMNPMIAILDKDIFDHYNVALPDESWTWEDVLSMAQKMTGTDPVTGNPTWGIQLNQTDSVSNRFFNYQLIASAFDAKTITYGKTVQDCKVDFTGEGTTKVFQMIADLAGYCSPDVREGVNVNSTITAENNVAIWYDQNAFTHYNEIVACGGEDRFVYLTMPVVESGEYKGAPSFFMGDHNMAICNTSKNKEWAWEFIKFLVTDEEATQWIVDCMQLPNNRAGMAAVKSAMGEKYTEVVSKALDKNPVGFNNSTNDFFNNVSFGSVTSDMGNVIGEILMGNMKPEEAGPYIQKNVDEYLGSMK